MRAIKFLIGTILIFFYLFNPSPSFAAVATCPIATSPSPVTSNDYSINVEFNGSGILVDGEKYYIKMNGNFVGDFTVNGTARRSFQTQNGILRIDNLNGNGEVNTNNANATFYKNPYTFQVTNDSGNYTFCTASLNVQQLSSGGTCQIHYKNSQPINVGEDIFIYATNLGGNPPDGRRVVLKRDKASGDQVDSICTNVDQLSKELFIGRHEAGSYYVEVRSGCDFLAKYLCSDTFSVGATGENSSEPVVSSPCKEETDPKTNKTKYVCQTAFGPITTTPEGFIKAIFGVLLSLSGGIAVILIIISGYRLMTSQGNPEKLQAAREQLTSAIIGLVFIIFSLSILQIIGVDILKIPGFSR